MGWTNQSDIKLQRRARATTQSYCLNTNFPKPPHSFPPSDSTIRRRERLYMGYCTLPSCGSAHPSIWIHKITWHEWARMLLRVSFCLLHTAASLHTTASTWPSLLSNPLRIRQNEAFHVFWFPSWIESPALVSYIWKRWLVLGVSIKQVHGGKYNMSCSRRRLNTKQSLNNVLFVEMIRPFWYDNNGRSNLMPWQREAHMNQI